MPANYYNYVEAPKPQPRKPVTTPPEPVAEPEPEPAAPPPPAPTRVRVGSAWSHRMGGGFNFAFRGGPSLELVKAAIAAGKAFTAFPNQYKLPESPYREPDFCLYLEVEPQQ